MFTRIFTMFTDDDNISVNAAIQLTKQQKQKSSAAAATLHHPSTMYRKPFVIKNNKNSSVQFLLPLFVTVIICELLSLTCAEDVAVAAPPASLPYAAALAAPGPIPGGANMGSSILEQFSPNCSAVSHIFQARGIDPAEIPQKPSNEMVLRYCESPSVGTCCTYNMETRMAMQSRQQLEKHSKEQIVKMSSMLGAKAQKFNEVFRKLLLKSKEEFHEMFTRTYGVIYQQNSYVFSDLFNELENYYARGRIDLLEVMDKFFNTLYQKMFQVLNAQFSFDDKYLRCVSEHMKELKPFGDVPDKLSVQIKRSFVATRTYGQALATAAEVSKKIINIRLNADCTNALTKMQHCGACKGYTEKPCTNYCINVIKGCLHYLNEFDSEWENFALAMDKVAERLLGSFNIVMVVEPINIKISEAIMNFQDAGQDITNRVLQGCGRPQLRRSRRAVNPKFNQIESINNDVVATNIVQTRSIPVEEQEQIESDILDIDASLDDAIVLRERRAAEPGQGSSQEETASSRGTNNGSNNGGNGNNNGSSGGGGNGGGGGGGGGGGNNRRNQQQQQQRRKQQQQNRRKNNNKDNDDEDSDYNDRNPVLDKLVRDIRQRVKDYKKFWANLPHQICSNEEISSSSDVDGMCWNGHTIDRYMHSVTTEHGSNPEFSGNPASTRQTAQVSTQLYYLKNAISHLRNAYNGQDVDWSEQEPYYGSGAGSGSGSEDDEDDDEGSGLSPFTPNHKPELTERPSVVGVNNVDDEDDADVDDSHTSRPKYTPGIGVGGGGASVPTHDHETNVLGEHERGHGGGNNDGDDDDIEEEGDDIDQNGAESKTSSASVTEKVSLRQALLVYLVPLYMAWFGGVCADLL